jgi:hypothetical protein
MEAEIGDAAGAIWQYLDEHGVTTLSKFRQGTKLPDQLLLLGVGWLAREGKLRLVREGRTVRVDLRVVSEVSSGRTTNVLSDRPAQVDAARARDALGRSTLSSAVRGRQ